MYKQLVVYTPKLNFQREDINIMKKVYIYTKSECIYCEFLIDYLEKNKIKYINVDFDKAPDEIQCLKKFPIIKINSDIIIGLELNEINKKLGINKLNNTSVYLDNAATTQLDRLVYKKMKPFLKKKFANPSSIYSIGINNRNVIEESRKNIAENLKCKPNEVYFTSGGSEANNMALKGVAFANKFKGNHIITSSIEHHSILNACRFLEENGFKVTYLKVNQYGEISLKELEKSINQQTILISIMAANNEIGTVQHIEEIARIAKKYNVYYHVDAVQAIGTKFINLNNIDLLSISAHKFYGPKGAGLLYIKENTLISPLIDGGSQENGRRGGTENIANIIGLSVAFSEVTKNRELISLKLKYLSKVFLNNLQMKNVNIEINGAINNRIPGNLNITFKDIHKLDNMNGIIFKMLLDSKNIYVSSSSACSENLLMQSHVLKAIGLTDEECDSTIRFTFSKHTSVREINYVTSEIIKILNKK